MHDNRDIDAEDSGRSEWEKYSALVLSSLDDLKQNVRSLDESFQTLAREMTVESAMTTSLRGRVESLEKCKMETDAIVPLAVLKEVPDDIKSLKKFKVQMTTFVMATQGIVAVMLAFVLLMSKISPLAL